MGNRLSFCKVQLIKEKSEVYADLRISSPSDAVRKLQPVIKQLLEDADRENFVVLYLDTKHKVTGVEIVSTGSLNASVVHPREVFKGALLHNAAAIICAHNHPSGDPTPSTEDEAVTKRLFEAGKLLGINLLDHLVIGEGGNYRSFREMGIITDDQLKFKF